MRQFQGLENDLTCPRVQLERPLTAGWRIAPGRSGADSIPDLLCVAFLIKKTMDLEGAVLPVHCQGILAFCQLGEKLCHQVEMPITTCGCFRFWDHADEQVPDRMPVNELAPSKLSHGTT